MHRRRCVDYSHDHFESLIRNFGQSLRKQLPETFATPLDENPRAKHAAIHQTPPFSPFIPPFHAARSWIWAWVWAWAMGLGVCCAVLGLGVGYGFGRGPRPCWHQAGGVWCLSLYHTSVQVQADWEWGSQRVFFKSRRALGVGVLNPGFSHGACTNTGTAYPHVP